MWYVYVIKSLVKPFVYVGSTNNMQRRLREHNQGFSRSTAPFKPYTLLTYIAVPSEKQARRLEQYFKTGSGRAMLKKRILDDEDLAKHEVLSEA